MLCVPGRGPTGLVRSERSTCRNRAHFPNAVEHTKRAIQFLSHLRQGCWQILHLGFRSPTVPEIEEFLKRTSDNLLCRFVYDQTTALTGHIVPDGLKLGLLPVVVNRQRSIVVMLNINDSIVNVCHE